MKKIPVKQEQIEKGFQKIKGASIEAFEEEFENVSQQLLKVIEESKQIKDLTSEQKEQLYEELEEIQQNISNLLQNRKQDIQISLRNMLEYQKNTDIGAQIISENISILLP